MQKLFYYLRIYGFFRFIWYLLKEVEYFFRGVLQNSYTPFGEDLIIDKLLGKKKRGFYVDIGAYDPIRFSNTKRFYQRGWSGINIEPNPNRISLFNKLRPRDINLNIGVANRNGALNYFRFEPESLSTFSKKVASTYQRYGYKLIETNKIEVNKLGEILEKYTSPNSKSIDFFSIDTEGFDTEVLRSNNWERFRPRVICIEAPSTKDPNYDNSERQLPHSTEKLLTELGYKKAVRTIPNCYFLTLLCQTPKYQY